MAHLVEELQRDAEAAVAAMREAALRARDRHARAELMRHMAMTTAPVKDRPRDAAVRHVVDHWLEAWSLDRAAAADPAAPSNGGARGSTRAHCPHLGEMERFAGAFHDYMRSATDAHDRDLREALAALEHAFAANGIALVDQMAWLSVCAHEWWGEVRPAPAGKGRSDRAWPERPYWERGCPPQCL
ncbi:MAG: hypothetical protein L6R19_17800 [Alphaproteobacteria bacterium]|nr:hypothetical protein [Alphaproteobacteria bacterium]